MIYFNRSIEISFLFSIVFLTVTRYNEVTERKGDTHNMKSYKKLIVTLMIIILVIVGLVYFGRREFKTNSLTNLNTNLLQIQAKVKGLADKAAVEKNESVLVGNEPSEETLKQFGLTPSNKIRILTQAQLDEIGLPKIKGDQKYLVDYGTTEVYYLDGYQDNQGNTYYKLSEITNVVIEN